MSGPYPYVSSWTDPRGAFSASQSAELLGADHNVKTHDVVLVEVGLAAKPAPYPVTIASGFGCIIRSDSQMQSAPSVAARAAKR